MLDTNFADKLNKLIGTFGYYVVDYMSVDYIQKIRVVRAEISTVTYDFKKERFFLSISYNLKDGEHKTVSVAVSSFNSLNTKFVTSLEEVEELARTNCIKGTQNNLKQSKEDLEFKISNYKKLIEESNLKLTEKTEQLKAIELLIKSPKKSDSKKKLAPNTVDYTIDHFIAKLN